MRQPAPTGPDSDARCDDSIGARGPGGRAVTRPASIEEKDRVLSEDSLSEDLKLNDAWLVEHARHGDNQSFAVLLRRYERKLIRVLTRLVDDPEQARDLAQETFWRVYSRLDRFDTSRRFGPWLFRLAINLGLDWIRHNKRDYLRPGSIDWIATNGQAGFELPDPDPRIQIELAQEVQFVLGLMPICYRTILVLRDLEGFSTSEVAAIVGRRESTVRWRLSVAREKFREIWERRQAIVRDTTDRIPKAGGPMIHRECEWVRARLPLWVGDSSGEQSDGRYEGCDLAANERCKIERHMDLCASCRLYQCSLTEALAAPWAAADQMPLEKSPPSLWPAIARRIASEDAPKVSRWRQAAGCVADWCIQAQMILDREPSFRIGWKGDASSAASTIPKGRGARFEAKRGFALRYGLMTLLAAATWIGVLVIGREWADAQATTVANAAPLAKQDVPAPIRDEPSHVTELDMDVEDSPGELAENALARAPEASGFGLDGTSPAKSSSQIRPGSDFDHGTPMAPDARDSKPVY